MAQSASSFVVHSRRVLVDGALGPATVHVEDGRITAVRSGDAVAGDAIRLGDLVLMPGLVDVHVHVNEPGRTAWEGFETATRAAACGGVTTLVDMPLNSDPVTTSRDAFAAKLSACGEQLHVDCAFWGGVVPGNAGELTGMVEDGVVGFKAFLCHSGIDDFPQCDARDLGVAMPLLRDAGVPLLVHAELESELRDAPEDADPRAYIAWLHSRPRASEDAAIAQMIALAEQTGCAVHIVHLSSATALPMLRSARARGVRITVETCPHYLCFVAEEVPDGATEFKCAPPIRGRENREALWQGLLDGTIDFVVTDHSPCVPSLKRRDVGDFLAAWGGISSLQLGLAAVWTEARARGVPLATVARWLSAAPAAFAGLSRTRGALRVGARADLVAWDPDAAWQVASEDLHHKHPLSPWVGQRLTGRVAHTWVGGHAVVRDGQLQEDLRVGRPVRGRAPSDSTGGAT